MYENLPIPCANLHHLQDKLLLLLSEYSIVSAWVEGEVEAALEKVGRQQREVLFPIRLDDAVMQTSQAWAATLRRTRHNGEKYINILSSKQTSRDHQS